jgi:hypothetical protein
MKCTPRVAALAIALVVGIGSSARAQQDGGFEHRLFAQAENAQPQPAGDGAAQPDAEPIESDMTASDNSFFGVGGVEDDYYVGGRGLISLHGMSGMFINPTSGTLGEGQLTIQWCVLLNEDLLIPDGTSVGVDVFGNGVMAAYGVTDWLEVGTFLLTVVVDPSPFKIDADTGGFDGDDETLFVGGPFVRVRLLEDKDWMPEVSVAVIYLDGDKSSDVLARQEIDLLASKYFSIDEEGVFKGIRVHGGVRHIFRHDAPTGLGIPADGTVGFVGLELKLPYDLYFISEVNTKDDVLGPRTPYSFGMQWRPNNVVGVSLAGMQPGDAGRISLWVGLGINFEF